jgi:hypothetical protein
VLKLSVLQGANGKETGPPASYPKGSHTLPHDPYGSFRPFYQVEEKEQGHRLQTLSLIRLENINQSPQGFEIWITDHIKTSRVGGEQPTLQVPFFQANSLPLRSDDA